MERKTLWTPRSHRSPSSASEPLRLWSSLSAILLWEKHLVARFFTHTEAKENNIRGKERNSQCLWVVVVVVAVVVLLLEKNHPVIENPRLYLYLSPYLSLPPSLSPSFSLFIYLSHLEHAECQHQDISEAIAQIAISRRFPYGGASHQGGKGGVWCSPYELNGCEQHALWARGEINYAYIHTYILISIYPHLSLFPSLFPSSPSIFFYRAPILLMFLSL